MQSSKATEKGPVAREVTRLGTSGWQVKVDKKRKAAKQNAKVRRIGSRGEQQLYRQDVVDRNQCNLEEKGKKARAALSKCQ